MTEREKLREELKIRRDKRKSMRERTFIMGATSIPDDNETFKEDIDPVEWASKFFEGYKLNKTRIRETKENNKVEKDASMERILQALEKAYDSIKEIVISSEERELKEKAQQDLRMLAKMMDRYREEYFL